MPSFRSCQGHHADDADDGIGFRSSTMKLPRTCASRWQRSLQERVTDQHRVSVTNECDGSMHDPCVRWSKLKPDSKGGIRKRLTVYDSSFRTKFVPRRFGEHRSIRLPTPGCSDACTSGAYVLRRYVLGDGPVGKCHSNFLGVPLFFAAGFHGSEPFRGQAGWRGGGKPGLATVDRRPSEMRNSILEQKQQSVNQNKYNLNSSQHMMARRCHATSRAESRAW